MAYFHYLVNKYFTDKKKNLFILNMYVDNYMYYLCIFILFPLQDGCLNQTTFAFLLLLF